MTSKQEGVNFISNMPDPILQMILSGLPTTEEVTRTSILSKRWRYLWTSIPSLDIDINRGPKSFLKFKEFVNGVLANKTLNLDSFLLCCKNFFNKSTLEEWIEASVMRKVKVLDLLCCPKDKSEVIELPHCLVTCESLEVLKLFLFRRHLRLPNYTGFPSLRVLELNRVNLFEEYLVNELLKSCPLLEDLSLIDCFIISLDVLCISCPNLKTLRIKNEKLNYYERDLDFPRDDIVHKLVYPDECVCQSLQITCPQLVFLEYAGHTAYEFSFENLHSLKKAVIYLERMVRNKFLESIVVNISIFDMFAGVSHVESLSLNHSFIQEINDARDPTRDFPATFPNLKTLELTTTTQAFAMKVLIRILKCSPNLESLHLTIQWESGLFWDLEEVETRRIFTHHLKRVGFIGFNEENPKLDIARFLLEHGNALEEMVFSWRNEVKYHDKSMETMNQVAKFYKASSSVKLIARLIRQRSNFHAYDAYEITSFAGLM